MLKILGTLIIKGLLKVSTFFTPTPTSGSLWLWGYNNYGAIGDDTNISKSSPVQTIAGGTDWKNVACGQHHTAAIKTDGTLWTWGRNYLGSLGDNTNVTYRSSPVQTITEGTNWIQLDCGMNSTAAIKTDGTLWLWGQNNSGQLGDNTITNKSSPVQTVCGGTNWKQVSCDAASTAAIKTDGTLWLWGFNLYGGLGINTNVTFRSSPVQTVAFGTNWKQVSLGIFHTAAIKTDGTLWTWGHNSYGQLGDNTIANRSSPVQTIAYGTNWKQVSCGGGITAATKTDGTLWTWGRNQFGQVGDNTTTNRSSPVQTIAYGTNWKQVSCGYYYNAAIKTDGTLWTWGENYKGVLGDNTIISRSSPIQTIAGGNSWIDVSANYVIAAIYQETTPAPTCGQLTSGFSGQLSPASFKYTFSSDGKNCYCCSNNLGKLISYEVSNNVLFSEIGSRFDLNDTTYIANGISGNGTVLCFATFNNNTVEVYKRNTFTGLLTYDYTFSIPDTNAGLLSVAVSFDGKFAYVTAVFENKVYILDLVNYTISDISVFVPRIAVITSSGHNLYVLQNNNNPDLKLFCFSIDQITGGLTLQFTYYLPYENGNAYSGLGISQDDKSVFATYGVVVNKLLNFSRSLDDGSLTLLQTLDLSGFNTVENICSTNDNKNVYIPNNNFIVDIFNRDLNTLLLTSGGTLSGGNPASFYSNANSTGLYSNGNLATRNSCDLTPPMPKSGYLWSWGLNSDGQLGDNTITKKSSPVQTIAGGNNWISLSKGFSFRTSAAIKSDGTLWLWGDNDYTQGVLGDNTTIDKSSPVQTITYGTNWKEISCGHTNAVAIKNDGTLWNWGSNQVGQLGDGTNAHKSSPVQTIAGGTDWKQASTGGGQTAAIKNDGTLWLWGYNFHGQLGDNTSIFSRSSPVQTIVGGTDWKQVFCGNYHTAAIKNDGTLWTWGNNNYGQLGDSTTTNRSSPIQTIAGGSNWKYVCAGYSNTLAVKTDGTLWTWGFNFHGQLGDNTAVDKSSPVQTITFGTTWQKVTAGTTIAAIKTDGTLWTWGKNLDGALGDNTTTSRSSPVQTIINGNNWIDVLATESVYGIKSS